MKTQASGAQYLILTLRDRDFVVPIDQVWEINQMPNITPVPMKEPHVVGVINLRGKVLALVDLGLVFGHRPYTLSKESCVLILQSQADKVGVIVDSVKSVVFIANSDIEPSVSYGGHGSEDFFNGMAKIGSNLAVMIDVEKALADVTIEGTFAV
ncbi:MAG: purine-binding chemotaxis protein CheW [Proteobacteria bacterium]|nr:MAG: purine-binding chemotaxis protein CheW [Pseudomonadota bacterium]